MTSSAQTTAIPRGPYMGRALCRPKDGARFFQCPICGGWVDGDDLWQVSLHEGQIADDQRQPVESPTALAS
jgi:hypothetical protein